MQSFMAFLIAASGFLKFKSANGVTDWVEYRKYIADTFLTFLASLLRRPAPDTSPLDASPRVSLDRLPVRCDVHTSFRPPRRVRGAWRKQIPDLPSAV